MRITSEMLQKLARDTVAKRVRSDRDILAAYLHGSLLSQSPLLGGTTDIDIFFVMNVDGPDRREIVRITDDIHLDLAYHPRSTYRQARELRLHPWLGPTLYSCKILHDPQHFLDFTQASVRGQFDLPENILARSRQLADTARQIWMAFQLEPIQPGPKDIQVYLRAVEHAGNAIAGLTGHPLTERRLLFDFPQRADAAGVPGLYHGLVGLLGGANVDLSQLAEKPPAWSEAVTALPEGTISRLHPYRFPYYLKAFEFFLGSDRPHDVLWPLLNTWTEAVCHLPEDSKAHQDWQTNLEGMGFMGDGFADRIDALDGLLDTVEEALDDWAAKRGVS